ncbi:MAG: TetR/AcrR family transcriptional regulator [Polyangiaceae bacterium]
MSERRQRILVTAERLFQHYGPAKTTMADIAKACGIAVGSVYLDFDSKETILRELAARKAAVVVDAMTSVRAGRVSERLVGMLRARVEALFALAENGQHACDLFRCKNSEPATEAFGEPVRALLIQVLEHGVAAGELVITDPHATVSTFELAFVGLSPPLVFTRARADAERAAEELARALVYGISRPDPGERHQL